MARGLPNLDETVRRVLGRIIADKLAPQAVRDSAEACAGEQDSVGFGLTSVGLAKYQHVAIAALEPDFSGFIFYELLDGFIAGYGEEEAGAGAPAAPAPASLGLELKKGVAPFQGSEAPGNASDATGSDNKSP